jgi:hypothetical protein
VHISDLVPQEGERAATFGGTRAGKSAFQEWSLRTIQSERPHAMQILADTKPRFRAETEKGIRPNWRRDAAHRYSDWSKGPVVPNSVVVDINSDHPFSGLFKTPGEVAIFQSGESADWKRILALLNQFVKMNIKGRERRIIVDECLDFMKGTRGVSTPKTTCSIAQHARAASGISDWTSGHTRYREYRDSFARCFLASRSFICGMTPLI